MYWELIDKLPEGWVIDKTVGSPKCGYVFCTNGKSVLNGQKRKLLKVFKPIEIEVKKQSIVTNFVIVKDANHLKEKDNLPFPAKTVNILARKKFEQHLFKEIMFDLMVCELEGWDKLEYLKELKLLINSISTKNIKQLPTTQSSLF